MLGRKTIKHHYLFLLKSLSKIIGFKFLELTPTISSTLRPKKKKRTNLFPSVGKILGLLTKKKKNGPIHVLFKITMTAQLIRQGKLD